MPLCAEVINMNFHSDEWIMEKLKEHYEEALEIYPEERIVGIFLQGSQNYGLDVENSDVDTKLIVIPSFYDIAMNKQPASFTRIRENDEHIDVKDIRLYMNCFRKQNINFVEILFTKYKIINPKYEEEWYKLVENRESIARYDEKAAIKCMVGMAREKYHALEHEYPSKIEIIKKYGYDAKQLHHLIRLYYFIISYLKKDLYENCLTESYKVNPNIEKHLFDVKNFGLSLPDARWEAEKTLSDIENIYRLLDVDKFTVDSSVDELLDYVQYRIMKKAISDELLKGDN